MADYAFRIILLFAILGSAAYSQKTELADGSVRIGDRCERDRNCIPHAYCRGQLSCACDSYYSPSIDKSKCIATVGLYCSNDTTCATMTNGQCRQGVCACKETYIEDIKNSSNCIGPPKIIGDQCQRNDECQETFDRALCINEQCQCVTGYRFINQTKKCIQKRGLYSDCTADYECYFHDENPNALECKRNVCLCREGEPGCSKGSLSVAAVLHVILLILLVRLI